MRAGWWRSFYTCTVQQQLSATAATAATGFSMVDDTVQLTSGGLVECNNFPYNSSNSTAAAVLRYLTRNPQLIETSKTMVLLSE